MTSAGVKKQVADQAEGLRQLMAGNTGKRIAVVDSEPGAGSFRFTSDLAAALAHGGQDVVSLDEHEGPQCMPLKRDAALVLVDAVLDKNGGLSPLAATADHVMVVFQANAAAVTKAYLCIKKLHYAHAFQRMRIVVNDAADPAEAKQMLANLASTGSRYLGLALESAGLVRADPLLAQARRLNLTVVEAFPASPATKDFQRLASELLQWPCRQAGDPASSLRLGLAESETQSVLRMC